MASNYWASEIALRSAFCDDPSKQTLLSLVNHRITNWQQKDHRVRIEDLEFFNNDILNLLSAVNQKPLEPIPPALISSETFKVFDYSPGMVIPESSGGSTAIYLRIYTMPKCKCLEYLEQLRQPKTFYHDWIAFMKQLLEKFPNGDDISLLYAGRTKGHVLERVDRDWKESTANKLANFPQGTTVQVVELFRSPNVYDEMEIPAIQAIGPASLNQAFGGFHHFLPLMPKSEESIGKTQAQVGSSYHEFVDHDQVVTSIQPIIEKIRGIVEEVVKKKPLHIFQDNSIRQAAVRELYSSRKGKGKIVATTGAVNDASNFQTVNDILLSLTVAKDITIEDYNADLGFSTSQGRGPVLFYKISDRVFGAHIGKRGNFLGPLVDIFELPWNMINEILMRESIDYLREYVKITSPCSILGLGEQVSSTFMAFGLEGFSPFKGDYLPESLYQLSGNPCMIKTLEGIYSILTPCYHPGREKHSESHEIQNAIMELAALSMCSHLLVVCSLMDLFDEAPKKARDHPDWELFLTKVLWKSHEFIQQTGVYDRIKKVRCTLTNIYGSLVGTGGKREQKPSKERSSLWDAPTSEKERMEFKASLVAQIQNSVLHNTTSFYGWSCPFDVEFGSPLHVQFINNFPVICSKRKSIDSYLSARFQHRHRYWNDYDDLQKDMDLYETEFGKITKIGATEEAVREEEEEVRKKLRLDSECKAQFIKLGAETESWNVEEETAEVQASSSQAPLASVRHVDNLRVRFFTVSRMVTGLPYARTLVDIFLENLGPLHDQDISVHYCNDSSDDEEDPDDEEGPDDEEDIGGSRKGKEPLVASESVEPLKLSTAVGSRKGKEPLVASESVEPLKLSTTESSIVRKKNLAYRELILIFKLKLGLTHDQIYSLTLTLKGAKKSKAQRKVESRQVVEKDFQEAISKMIIMSYLEKPTVHWYHCGCGNYDRISASELNEHGPVCKKEMTPTRLPLYFPSDIPEDYLNYFDFAIPFKTQAVWEILEGQELPPLLRDMLERYKSRSLKCTSDKNAGHIIVNPDDTEYNIYAALYEFVSAFAEPEPPRNGLGIGATALTRNLTFEKWDYAYCGSQGHTLVSDRNQSCKSFSGSPRYSKTCDGCQNPRVIQSAKSFEELDPYVQAALFKDFYLAEKMFAKYCNSFKPRPNWRDLLNWTFSIGLKPSSEKQEVVKTQARKKIRKSK